MIASYPKISNRKQWNAKVVIFQTSRLVRFHENFDRRLTNRTMVLDLFLAVLRVHVCLYFKFNTLKLYNIITLANSTIQQKTYRFLMHFLYFFSCFILSSRKTNIDTYQSL